MIDLIVKKEHLNIEVGYTIARDVRVRKVVPELEQEKQQILKEIRRKYGSVPLLKIPEICAYRNYLRSLGLDPSKDRAATEYLMRRVLAGKFPSINNLVDLCLLAMVCHWVIVGVYDLDKIRGDLLVTVESKVETFKTIDGREVTPVIGEIILKDSEKIIASYAMGDAKTTMITSETKNALVVVWNAPGISRENVAAALAMVNDYIGRFCGGSIEKSDVLN